MIVAVAVAIAEVVREIGLAVEIDHETAVVGRGELARQVRDE